MRSIQIGGSHGSFTVKASSGEVIGYTIPTLNQAPTLESFESILLSGEQIISEALTDT